MLCEYGAAEVVLTRTENDPYVIAFFLSFTARLPHAPPCDPSFHKPPFAFILLRES